MSMHPNRLPADVRELRQIVEDARHYAATGDEKRAARGRPSGTASTTSAR